MSGDQHNQAGPLNLDAIEARAKADMWSGSRDDAVEALCKIADVDVPALVAEVRRLRAREAEVRSLADEWDNLDPGLAFHMVHWDYRTELRAALDDA